MTTDTQNTTPVDHKNPISFGVRLKSAREALGLERKDAADQLRLTEKIIIMMEKDRYPSDLPVTFIKGYLRAYAKLLQIPEHEVKKAVEPIKQKPGSHESAPILLTHTVPVSSGSFFMQLLTYLIIFTLMALVAIWWYTHNPMTRNEQASVLEDLPASPSPTASVQTMPQATTSTQTAVNNGLPGQPATEREKMVESTANAAAVQPINPMPIENKSDIVSAPADNNITNPQQAIGMQATVLPKTTTQPEEAGYDDDEDDGDDSEV